MPKVLVVDDDQDFVNVTSKVLENAGHEVVSAANGTEAMETMRKDAPDVVLLDIMMSHILDGLDVSRKMAEDSDLKEIPVIMVTALTGVKGAEVLPPDEYVAVDDWLSKPVDPDTLIQRIDEAVN